MEAERSSEDFWLVRVGSAAVAVRVASAEEASLDWVIIRGFEAQ